MIGVFENIYKAENFDEKINKKCCRGVSRYLVKCFVCQEIVCFNHAEIVKKSNKNKLVCYLCV